MDCPVRTLQDLRASKIDEVDCICPIFFTKPTGPCHCLRPRTTTRLLCEPSRPFTTPWSIRQSMDCRSRFPSLLQDLKAIAVKVNTSVSLVSEGERNTTRRGDTPAQTQKTRPSFCRFIFLQATTTRSKRPKIRDQRPKTSNSNQSTSTRTDYPTPPTPWLVSSLLQTPLRSATPT